MIKRKLIFYSKIVFVLFLTFLLTQFLSKEVFISDSPKVRRDVWQHLASLPSRYMEEPEYLVNTLFVVESSPTGDYTPFESMYAFFTIRTLENTLQRIPLDDLAPGVYARETDEIRQTVLDTSEHSWLEQEIEVNGKLYRVSISAEDEDGLSIEELSTIVQNE